MSTRPARIELEQRIMECWGIVDDIKDVYTAHQDLEELDVDTMSTVLLGIEQLYKIKFELLWKAFEATLREETK